MLAVIPFAGFYSSWHDHELDRALEQMLSDESGDPNEDLVRRAFDEVEWRKVHVAYATAYAENFGLHFKIDLKFESLNSPKFYNFSTDRIFVELETEEVERLFDATERVHLDAVCKAEFTSRSGFSSSYSPDWTTWGPPEEWDHNQVFALICAYVRQEHGEEFSQDDEMDLMEHERCNGGYDEMLWKAGTPEFKRIAKISDYLRERSNRQYRPFWAAFNARSENHA